MISSKVIVSTPEEFLEHLASGDYPVQKTATPKAVMPKAVLPKAVMMVEPAGFHISAQSASDNLYMNPENSADSARALQQSANLAVLIRQQGIEVLVFPGDVETPDAIFPNNVFATTSANFIIGHMLHPVRQKEAQRADIREYFESNGYRTIDLSKQDCITELTGPLIIDHARSIGFCGMTGRVDQAGLQAMLTAFNLKMIFSFDLLPNEYHTNVVMMILAGRACVIYPGAFADPAVPAAINKAFPQRTLILNEAEKNAFAGNCIALSDKDLFMSATGVAALRPESRKSLESWGFIIHSTPLDEIEKAGGSMRCMLAEIF